MKKLFAIVAVMGVLTFGSTQLAQAQDAPAAEQTEQAAPAAQAAPADEAIGRGDSDNGGEGRLSRAGAARQAGYAVQGKSEDVRAVHRRPPAGRDRKGNLVQRIGHHHG